MKTQSTAISHEEFAVQMEPLSLPKEIAKTPKALAIVEKIRKSQQQIPSKFQKPESSKLSATIGPETKALPTFVLK